MNDRTEPLSNLASLLYGPALMTGEDETLLKLLDELVRAWLETLTPIQIGSDVEKIRVLQQARASVSEGEPSDLVKQLYKEVFLEDVWSGVGCITRRPA